MSKGSKKFLIIAIILILIILSGIVFVNKILPKIMTSYLTGENAPEFMGEINSQIRQNAVYFNQALKDNGISNDQAVDIIKNFDYNDLKEIQTELQAEGYKDSKKCAEIIASHIDSESVDKDKITKLLEDNITPAMLEQGINQLANTKPALVKAALPTLQEIAIKTLKETEGQ